MNAFRMLVMEGVLLCTSCIAVTEHLQRSDTALQPATQIGTKVEDQQLRARVQPGAEALDVEIWYDARCTGEFQQLVRRKEQVSRVPEMWSLPIVGLELFGGLAASVWLLSTLSDLDRPSTTAIDVERTVLLSATTAVVLLGSFVVHVVYLLDQGDRQTEIKVKSQGLQEACSTVVNRQIVQLRSGDFLLQTTTDTDGKLHLLWSEYPQLQSLIKHNQRMRIEHLQDHIEVELTAQQPQVHDVQNLENNIVSTAPSSAAAPLGEQPPIPNSAPVGPPATVESHHE